MSQALFELYKEALRRGHVAAVQGRLDAALAAYEAASTIAPDRALPHASLGDVLRRLGRSEAAEHAYDAALQRAPMDEAALRGRAAARLELERPVDAARDLEALADVLERANRIPEACEAACSALELGESRSRQQAVERLAAAMTGLSGEIGVAAALARAEPFLDPSRSAVSSEPVLMTATEPVWADPAGPVSEPVVEPMAPDEVAPIESGKAASAERAPAMAAGQADPHEAVAEPAEPEPAAHEHALDAAEPEPAAPEHAATAATVEPEPAEPAEPELAESVATVEPAATAEPEPAEPVEPEPAARHIPIDVVAARVEAENLLAVGEVGQARDLLLEIAASERAAGRLDAALDACLILVAVDPADVAVQMELAAIQAARGWTDIARDKLALLTRLAELDANATALVMIQGSSVVHELASSRGKGGHAATHP